MQNLLTTYNKARNFQLCGDTLAARQEYQLLARDFTQMSKTELNLVQKQIYLIQAAVASYEGGQYQNARNLLQSVDTSMLDKKWYGILVNKSEHAKLRATAKWQADKARELDNAIKKKNHRRILFILADCPYLMPCQLMAGLRVEACVGLEDHALAESFRRDEEALKAKYGQYGK